MNRRNHMPKAITVFRPALSTLMIMAGTSAAMAQTPGDSSGGEGFHWSDVHFAVAQKFWYASFESTPLVARVVVPPGSSTPVVQTSLDSSTSSKLMPITAVSLSWKDLSVSASASPRTSFSNPDSPNGSIARDEHDFALAYAFLHPGESKSRLSVLADYKVGDVKPITGSSITDLLGVQGNARVSAILLGLSGVSPVATIGGNDLYLYGNAALGIGHTHFSTPIIHTLSTHYSIAEVGLSYPLSGIFSLQFGYRSQNYTLRKAPFVTVSPSSPGTILTSETRDFQSSTEGAILGVTASF